MSLRNLLRSVAFAIALASALPAHAEYQPHMIAGREQLNAALASLEKADADKGGHRAKAIAFIRQALAQINEGIAYDNAHKGKRK